MRVLVTGAAGFIGMHCAERLARRGDEVTGLENLSPYYSVELKRARLARLGALPRLNLTLSGSRIMVRPYFQRQARL